MALFGRNEEGSMAKQSNISAPNQLNMIGEGTVFEGTLKADSDVRISGRVVGKLDIQGKVIVAQEGAIEGEVKALSLDVGGKILGEIDVAERVVLKSSANVEGNIRTARLVVEEGAVFDGKCTMGKKTVEAGKIIPAKLKEERPESAPSRAAVAP